MTTIFTALIFPSQHSHFLLPLPFPLLLPLPLLLPFLSFALRFTILAFGLAFTVAFALTVSHDLCHDLGEVVGLSKARTVTVPAILGYSLPLLPTLRSEAWRLAHDINRVRPLQRPSARFDGLERLHHQVSFPPSLRFTMD